MLSSAIETKDLDVEKIWFSDEAHFWLNGYGNKQNYRFGGKEQPFITQSKPLHPEHLTCGQQCQVILFIIFLQEM